MFRRFFDESSLDNYYFKSDIFPTIEDRCFWDAFQNDTCIKEAEEALDYNWPAIKATDFMAFKKNGNRAIMEAVHYERRRHLILFLLAELKENKGRFLPQITNGLFSICEETYWGVSAHYNHMEFGYPNIPSYQDPYIDLCAGETAEHLSMIITLLEKPLSDFCPEIIDRVKYELERRIMTPYEQRYDFWWMGHCKTLPNNWNPWIISNVLIVFLQSNASQRRKRKAIRKALLELRLYYNVMPSDGGCDEGTQYWGKAGASLYECLYQLKQSTNGELNLFNDEKICAIASYMKKTHLYKDVFVNVADARFGGLANHMLLLYGFAKDTKQEDLMNFSAFAYKNKTDESNPLSHTVLTVRRLILQSQALHEIDEYKTKLPIHGKLEYLPELQLAVIREGEFVLSAKGGHNDESHNHNDIGSFEFCDENSHVLIDVGIGTYTRDTFSNQRYLKVPWTRTEYHNLPIINATEQTCGKAFRADSFRAEDERIEISFAGAYPLFAGVKEVRRVLTLNQKGMICSDSFTFSDNNCTTVEEVLMTTLPVRVDGDRVILGEKYEISTAEKTTVSTQFVAFNDVKLETSWQTEGVTRIIFSCKSNQTVTVKVQKM